MNQSWAVSRIQNLIPLDGAAILALNNANSEETSVLDETGMEALLRDAFYARGIEDGKTAFLVAFDHKAPYVNPNFNWFKEQRESFIYIDRVIVAQGSRGRGLGRKLYRDLFAAATQAGHDRVVCEVNINPPNLASEAFHATMGFLSIGEATIHNGRKTVRYFEKILE